MRTLFENEFDEVAGGLTLVPAEPPPPLEVVEPYICIYTIPTSWGSELLLELE